VTGRGEAEDNLTMDIGGDQTEMVLVDMEGVECDMD